MTEQHRGFTPAEVANADQAAGIRERRIVVTQVMEGRLPQYEKAGQATGYAVRVVADEKGQRFLTQGMDKYRDIVPVEASVAKGNVAVSIERPEGAKSHDPFWEKLKGDK